MGKKSRRKVETKETQYEVAGMRLSTPCPFNKVTREGHGFPIHVGSGACHECGCFIRDEQAEKKVLCKGAISLAKKKQS